jgi:DNA-binding CsgD family transcriptional regulator
MMSRKKGNLVLIPVERTYLELIWDGQSQKEAAAMVGLTLMQANSVLRMVKRRWQVPSTIALLRRALQLGVLAP